MCGILGIFNSKTAQRPLKTKANKQMLELLHRGPDCQGLKIIEKEDVRHCICHQRLTIVDTSEDGKQPFTYKHITWVANGEIYNSVQLREQLKDEFDFTSTSDSMVIGFLYQKYGQKAWSMLEGMFAIILYDESIDKFFFVRDHMGIIPLYYGQNDQGEIYVSSELKAIQQFCNIEIVLPGRVISNDLAQISWYDPKWQNMQEIPEPVDSFNYEELKDKLESAVLAQLQGDVPFGLLISGGLDSSLTAAITVKMVKEGKIDLSKRGMTKVHSFCIGLKGSPDLAASKLVADYLGTEHHPFEYTVDEGIQAIPQVIYHTETFNNTTIRASTPMYLLARKIKALGIKYCLTGEGADELFGGYLYFHKAPNAEEFHKECIRKVTRLYTFDLLRANKSTMAWGLEVRPPFLQKSFIEYVMGIDPRLKMITKEQPMEKHILRQAFEGYLPKEVQWRQKEQFSDGVGYSWRDGILDYCEEEIEDSVYEQRKTLFPQSTPMNKEQFWYRQIFEERFPSQSAVQTVPYVRSVACSTEEALQWDKSFLENTDESGRAVLGVHDCSEKLQGTYKANEETTTTTQGNQQEVCDELKQQEVA